MPFTYGASVLRPRKRLHDEVRYRDYVDVVVPETDAGNAPVVLHGTVDDPRGIPTHRFHEGELWKPWDLMRHGDGRSGPKRAHLAGEAADADDVAHPLHHSDGHGSRDRGAVTFESDRERVRDVRADTRATVLAEAVDRAKGLLLVGDDVWIRAVEPVFAINRSFNGDHVTVREWEPGKDDQYRLDLGHLIANAEGGGARGGRRADDFEPPDVGLVRPDLLRARTTEHAARDTTARLVESMARKLRDAGRDELLAYADLRDGLRASTLDMVEGRGCDPAAVLRGMGRAVDLLERLSGGVEGWARAALRNVTVRVEGDPTVSPSSVLAGFSA